MPVSYGVASREKPEKAESAENEDGGDDDSEARTGPEHPGTLVGNPRHEDLRTYLVSTFVNVEKSGESIVPLLYLAEPEGGRVLGNAKVGALVAAVRNGDLTRVTEALEQLPDEHSKVAAEHDRKSTSLNSSDSCATTITHSAQ